MRSARALACGFQRPAGNIGNVLDEASSTTTECSLFNAKTPRRSEFPLASPRRRLVRLCREQDECHTSSQATVSFRQVVIMKLSL